MLPMSEHLEDTFFGFARVDLLKEKQIQSYDYLKKLRNPKQLEKFAQFWLQRGENLAH